MADSAIIGYQNLFDSASTVVASNEVTGFEGENCYDWLAYDWWKPGATGDQTLTATFASSQSPDYFACFAHNLGGEGASIVLQANVASVWTDQFTDVSPTGTEVVFRYFASGDTSTQWRILITDCTVDTVVGVAAFGDSLILPHGIDVGFTPPNLHRDTRILNSVSVGGVFLGRSLIRNGNMLNLKSDKMEPSWIRSDWEPFMDHAETKPFFFSWNYDSYPGESAYCWTSGGVDPVPYSSSRHMRISLDADARVE